MDTANIAAIDGSDNLGSGRGEGGEEEGRALRGLEGWWGAEVDAVAEGGLRGEGEDVDVGGTHELFLDAGGGDVDEITGGEVSLGLLDSSPW